MTSRETILANVRNNQPPATALPELNFFSDTINVVEKFCEVLVNIGGSVLSVPNIDAVLKSVQQNYLGVQRIVTTIPELKHSLNNIIDEDAHLLYNVDLAILNGTVGVSENGAIWITDDQMGNRALPFITQHLSIVIKKNAIVPTLHEAYEHIGETYNYGTFIAGPSKTADIEQSLVLGAHGPKSLRVFLLEN